MIRIDTPRASIYITDRTVMKCFNDEWTFGRELSFYQDVPWACPQLLNANRDHHELTVAKHSLASHYPYMPVEELAELLVRLANEGIHHRDVHPGNIVATDDGPKLIDWETACYRSGPSYDLFGPEASGIEIPKIHQETDNGYAMWWGAYEHMSIRNCWRAELPHWIHDKVAWKP